MENDLSGVGEWSERGVEFYQERSRGDKRNGSDDHGTCCSDGDAMIDGGERDLVIVWLMFFVFFEVLK